MKTNKNGIPILPKFARPDKIPPIKKEEREWDELPEGTAEWYFSKNPDVKHSEYPVYQYKRKKNGKKEILDGKDYPMVFLIYR